MKRKLFKTALFEEFIDTLTPLTPIIYIYIILYYKVYRYIGVYRGIHIGDWYQGSQGVKNFQKTAKNGSRNH